MTVVNGLASWSWDLGKQKRPVGKPMAVSTECEYLCIAPYPPAESIHYGRSTNTQGARMTQPVHVSLPLS